jgi:hypothetical protein
MRLSQRGNFKIIVTLIIVFNLASCAYLSKDTVDITIASDPTGAKIFIDNVDYGTTNSEIKLVPNHSYNLRIVKDGYRPVEMTMDTQFTFRKGRTREYNRCIADAIGSIFILPIYSLNSVRCRDFTKILYSADLEPAPQMRQQSNSAGMPFPIFNRNYYFPSANQNPNPAAQPVPVIDQNRVGNQPVFNNQSEFVGSGNDVNGSENYNNKSKIDYYNWQ